MMAETAGRGPTRRWVDHALPLGGVLLAVLVATSARWGPDWPAQEFRAWAAHSGLSAWSNAWYGGQPLPGYSVLYPLLSAALGSWPTGVAAAAAAAVAAARMAPTGSRHRAVGYHVSVAVVLAADLLIGQVPYLVGVAFGVWALWAVRTGRSLTAIPLATACSLASPLAGGFLLLALPALGAAYGLRRALPFAAGVAGPAVSLLYGGASGPFPFPPRVLACVVAFAVGAVVLTRRQDRPVRILGYSYALAAAAAVVIPNPVGGNLARFGQLVALPLLWHLLPRLRWRARAVSLVLVALTAFWPTWPAMTSAAHGAADPSRNRSYYTGLLSYLGTQDRTAGRLEVVFTREHWEAYYVARKFPIARGWERQTDLAVNHVLYAPLSAGSYRHWLEDNGVALVALPDAPIDYGGQAEAQLLRNPPSYLQPVWHDRHWRVWRVRGTSGLVRGAARVATLGPNTVDLDFAHAATVTVRIHSNGMWSIVSGTGCVGGDAQGWMTVTATRPGRLRLAARIGVPEESTETRCTAGGR